jgi:hypothetical protein
MKVFGFYRGYAVISRRDDTGAFTGLSSDEMGHSFSIKSMSLNPLTAVVTYSRGKKSWVTRTYVPRIKNNGTRIEIGTEGEEFSAVLERGTPF